ncbi:MAG: DNA-directed RNA polymerase subunit L [Nanoarchaeota archaeon]|nr:DNA-directed RNA polymerase subunit L [Nanoarchaeota archaeon]MBU1029900.1 DNA-directed RNA polymerase subunit L [Nanoarchaeota archaeon]MBU1849823.1 DNA-directed RNA polymerase subunit L [Nanoarchaeota archaeon]
MEIKFLEDTKYRVVFELKGTDHTFVNALKEELWNDADIKIAAYNIEHPLIGIPKIIVETGNSKKDAKKAIMNACDRIKKENTQFLTKFKKAK